MLVNMIKPHLFVFNTATVYRCFNVIKTGPPLKARVLFFMRVRATCKLSLQVR